MKKNIKHSVIFLVIYMFFASHSTAADFIIPQKKPIIDNETKITILKKKRILPEKKPTKKVEKTGTVEKKITTKSSIYPKEKPGSESQPQCIN